MGDEAIKELRKAGIDSSLANNDGQSAMDLARELGEEETMTRDLEYLDGWLKAPSTLYTTYI